MNDTFVIRNELRNAIVMPKVKAQYWKTTKDLQASLAIFLSKCEIIVFLNESQPAKLVRK